MYIVDYLFYVSVYFRAPAGLFEIEYEIASTELHVPGFKNDILKSVMVAFHNLL